MSETRKKSFFSKTRKIQRGGRRGSAAKRAAKKAAPPKPRTQKSRNAEAKGRAQHAERQKKGLGKKTKKEKKADKQKAKADKKATKKKQTTKKKQGQKKKKQDKKNGSASASGTSGSPFGDSALNMPSLDTGAALGNMFGDSGNAFGDSGNNAAGNNAAGNNAAGNNAAGNNAAGNNATGANAAGNELTAEEAAAKAAADKAAADEAARLAREKAAREAEEAAARARGVNPVKVENTTGKNYTAIPTENGFTIKTNDRKPIKGNAKTSVVAKNLKGHNHIIETTGKGVVNIIPIPNNNSKPPEQISYGDSNEVTAL